MEPDDELHIFADRRRVVAAGVEDGVAAEDAERAGDEHHRAEKAERSATVQKRT